MVVLVCVQASASSVRVTVSALYWLQPGAVFLTHLGDLEDPLPSSLDPPLPHPRLQQPGEQFWVGELDRHSVGQFLWLRSGGLVAGQVLTWLSRVAGYSPC